MALFKIHKGSANNLGKTGNITQYTQEGYAYFTTEDGKFYIDIAGDGTTPAQLGINRLPLNAYKADRDEDGNRIVTNYVKRTKETKQTISVTSGGTALRLNSFNKHGSLIEFSNTQSSTNESGETVETQVSLGYLGVWDGSPCYYYNDSPYNILHAGNYSSYALPLSGGTLTGSLSLGNTNWILQDFYTGESSITSRQNGKAHAIQLGVPGRDYLNFYEYGGVFNFYKTSDIYTDPNSTSDGVLIAQITPDGFIGNLNGNAATATKLATARTISLTGSVTGSGSFDGSGNLSIATTTNHTHTSLPDGTTISGHLRVGNNINGDTNYIAFYGTQGDQPGSYNHTFIGENLYGTSEASELIIFKGNDIGNGPTVPSEPGPERIRHIAATHLFQSYTTPLLGSFVEICDSTVPINIMGIDSAGVYVYKNLTVNGTLTGTLNGNAATATKLATARNFSIGNAYCSFDGSADVNLDTTNIFSSYSTGTLNISWDDLYTGFTTMYGSNDYNWSGTNCPPGGFYKWGGTFTLKSPSNNGGFAQLYFAHTASDGHGILYRSGWGVDRKSWATILDSNNYTSYCAPAGHTHSYLPLAGGTITGKLSLSAATSGTSPMDQRITINGVANSTAVADAPGIGFHTGSVGWATIKCVGSSFYFYDSSCSGYVPIYGSQVYGAVWNDYAEYRSQNETIEPGYIAYCDDDGKLKKTTERLQKFEGVVSDTFGFAIGETDDCKTPLAVSGRALVYCDPEEEHFHSGDCVCAGPDGLAYRMTREEIAMYPDRIVGVVSEIPTYETWGSGNVAVNGRIWVKVK